MKLRAVVKRVAHKTRLLHAYHNLLHRNFLTVLMFHRVLPESELVRLEADPTYTVTPTLLASMLAFVNRHYFLVGAQDVLASLRREKPLPPWPLLITFDDGWRDNVQWGVPVLRGCPWTMFVAADAESGSALWWQETLLWTLRTRRATFGELWGKAGDRATGNGHTGSEDVLALLVRFAALSPRERAAALAPYEADLRSRCNGRQMVGKEDLILLRNAGVDLGAHGASHLPLSRISDAAGDLKCSWLWSRTVGASPILSFPHGRYDASVIQTARDVGYEAIFTSDPVLNACPDGWLQSAVIGRLLVTAESACDKFGELSGERVSAYLYLRERGGHKSEFP